MPSIEISVAGRQYVATLVKAEEFHTPTLSQWLQAGRYGLTLLSNRTLGILRKS